MHRLVAALGRRLAPTPAGGTRDFAEATGERLLYCTDAPAAAADGTVRIQVLRTGTWNFPDYGKVEITPGDIAEAASHFAAGARGQQLPVNIEHRRESGAVGWYERVEPDPTGTQLWATVRLTPTGQQLVKDEKFKYFSPELLRNTTDPETQARYGTIVVGGALTNYPRLKRMAPILAASEPVAAALAQSGLAAADASAALAPVAAPVALADLGSEHIDGPVGAVTPLHQGGGDYHPAPAQPRGAHQPAPGHDEDGDGDDDLCSCPADCSCRDANGKCYPDAGGMCPCHCDEDGSMGADDDDDDDEGNPAVADQGAPTPTGRPAVAGKRLQTSEPPAPAFAARSTADTNDLPDSAFAHIEPGGTKDAAGKTVPRSKRHLPYRHADGSVDLPHLRDALSRLDQTNIPAAAKAAARKKLEAAARQHGVGDYAEPHRRGQSRPHAGGTSVEDDEIQAKLAKIAEFEQRFGEFDPAQVAEMQGQLATLMAERENTSLLLQAAEARVQTLEQANALLAMNERIEGLVKEGRVLPAEREPLVNRLVAMADDDAEFLLSFLADRPPLVDLAEHGSAAPDVRPGDDPDRKDLHERAQKYAEEHNVSYRDAVITLSRQGGAQAA